MSRLIADLRHLWALLDPWEQYFGVVLLIVVVGVIILAAYWIEGVALMTRLLADSREPKLARFTRRLRAQGHVVDLSARRRELQRAATLGSRRVKS